MFSARGMGERLKRPKLTENQRFNYNPWLDWVGFAASRHPVSQFSLNTREYDKTWGTYSFINNNNNLLECFQCKIRLKINSGLRAFKCITRNLNK